MPSIPNNIGNRITAPSSNTKFRIKDISADTWPLFNAVKKAEPKIAIPVNKYATETMRKACTAYGRSFSVPYRNIAENGCASISERTNIETEESPII